MLPRRVGPIGVGVVVLALLAAPATAQNEPGDECIIQVQVLDDLATVVIRYDLLFDDAGWAALVDAIDRDGDGYASAAEIVAYEEGSRAAMDADSIPDDRKANLGAEMGTRWSWGWIVSGPDDAETETLLVDFEGPLAERTGKVVREVWTYHFGDIMADYDASMSTAGDARGLQVRWGPDASAAPYNEIAVVETVVATAPAGWLVAADGASSSTATFASGAGYTIHFVREEPLPPPPDPPLGIDFAVVAAMALGALAAVGLIVWASVTAVRRRRG